MDHDSQLRDLLLQLQDIIYAFGPRSEEVRAFIKTNDGVEEFVDLAAIMILAADSSL